MLACGVMHFMVSIFIEISRALRRSSSIHYAYMSFYGILLKFLDSFRSIHFGLSLLSHSPNMFVRYQLSPLQVCFCVIQHPLRAFRIALYINTCK